jgi:hypothetical protein
MLKFAIDAITGFSIAPLRISLYVASFFLLTAMMTGFLITLEEAPAGLRDISFHSCVGIFMCRACSILGAGLGFGSTNGVGAGSRTVLGVDGDYVGADRLVIPRERFTALDLSEPIWLGRRFDLVQSLEVAEHIPGSKAEVFIDSLVAHGDLILFAACPSKSSGPDLTRSSSDAASPR